MNEYGEIAERCWNDLPCHVDNCEFDEYIIMPDHVHGIVVIHDSFHVVPRGFRGRRGRGRDGVAAKHT